MFLEGGLITNTPSPECSRLSPEIIFWLNVKLISAGLAGSGDRKGPRGATSLRKEGLAFRAISYFILDHCFKPSHFLFLTQ